MNLNELLMKKGKKENIVAVQACDPMTAKIVSKLGIDMILVGKYATDSFGYHSSDALDIAGTLFLAKTVKKASIKTIVVVDLPSISYKWSTENIVTYAKILLEKSCADAIKVNCNIDNITLVKALVGAGVPIQGHIKFPINIDSDESISIATKQALTLSEALDAIGVFSLLLDNMPKKLAEHITKKIKIPTIGFLSGRYCDGQIANAYDIISYRDRGLPIFYKSYVNTEYIVESALKEFKREVLCGEFP